MWFIVACFATANYVQLTNDSYGYISNLFYSLNSVSKVEDTFQCFTLDQCVQYLYPVVQNVLIANMSIFWVLAGIPIIILLGTLLVCVCQGCGGGCNNGCGCRGCCDDASVDLEIGQSHSYTPDFQSRRDSVDSIPLNDLYSWTYHEINHLKGTSGHLAKTIPGLNFNTWKAFYEAYGGNLPDYCPCAKDSDIERHYIQNAVGAHSYAITDRGCAFGIVLTCSYCNAPRGNLPARAIPMCQNARVTMVTFYVDRNMTSYDIDPHLKYADIYDGLVSGELDLDIRCIELTPP